MAKWGKCCRGSGGGEGDGQAEREERRRTMENRGGRGQRRGGTQRSGQLGKKVQRGLGSVGPVTDVPSGVQILDFPKALLQGFLKYYLVGNGAEYTYAYRLQGCYYSILYIEVQYPSSTATFPEVMRRPLPRGAAVYEALWRLFSILCGDSQKPRRRKGASC